MNGVERRDRAIDTGELHHDETVKKRALTKAAKPLIWHTCDPKRAVLADQFEWKFSATPILVNDRRHFLFRERPHPAKPDLIRRAHYFSHFVEISIDIPS